METTLAILLVLGIFISVPAFIGFCIGGTRILLDRCVRRSGRTRLLEREVAELFNEEPAEARSEIMAKEPTIRGIPIFIYMQV